MDARSLIQWIGAILVILMGTSCPAYAGLVYIYGADFDLPIPANPDATKGWMDDAIINVTDHIPISDLDVSITLTHGSLYDLQILLKSPASTNVALNLAGNLAFIVRGEDGRLTALGGSGELFFDDEAELSIEQATNPFVGSFKPVWSLSSLDKEDAYGPWRLQIHDRYYAHTGTLNSFELIITTPEPASAILLLLGTAIMRLHKRRVNPKNLSPRRRGSTNQFTN